MGEGVSYSATIPAQPTGTSVEYCITTSTVDLSQVVGSGIIDSLTLSTSPHSHYVVAPGATPTATPFPPATSAPKGTPPPTPLLSGLTYNGGTPFVDGTNLITGTTYTITAQASSNTQSVVFATNGKTAATVSLAAFSFTFTAPANTAAYILTVTPWSWVQGTGTQGASITVNYNVVAASSPTPTPTATPVDTPTPTPTPANHAPVVNAGQDQIIATLSTGLSGSATDDGLPKPPGTLTYVWSKVSGSGSVTFGNAQTAITTATFSVGGIYTLKLSSSDGALTGTDTVVLTVNKSPVVNAGPDQTITLPGAATLSGSATDDGIPNPPGTLSYTWTKSTGPGTVTFADAHAASTTAAFSVAGTYTLQLSASDGVFSSSDKLIVIVNPNPSPDLKVTVTDGKTTIVAGTQNTYTIIITNAGPVAVTGASVIDTFPSFFTGVTFTATQSGGAAGFVASGVGNINDTVDMPSGSKITYTAKGKVSSSSTGTLSNAATVSAPAGLTDPNLADNTATDTDTINVSGDLQITVTDGKTVAPLGSKDTYTIVVKNSGPSNVVGATIQDNFPGGLTAVTFTATQTGGASGFTASGSGNVNDTVTLLSGSSITYKATGTINSSASGLMSDSATISVPVGVTDPNAANNTATDTDTLVAQADLKMTITDGKSAATAGTKDTYTITVSNPGPSTATGAVVNDTFPSTFTAVTFTTTQSGGASGFTPSGSGNISDTVTLPGASSITYKAIGTISSSASGSISDTATVSIPAGFTDPNAANNTATDTDML